VATFFTTVLSGQFTSVPIALTRADHAFAVECPSNGVAASVGVAFAMTSGTPPFQALQRSDGSGLAWTVHSGGGGAVGIVPQAPSPWLRIVLGAAPSAAMTYSIHELNR
jgi:hypothetical protein